MIERYCPFVQDKLSAIPAKAGTFRLRGDNGYCPLTELNRRKRICVFDI